MQPTPTPHQIFTGRHMAFILVTFFAVVIGVNVTMATLASRSWTGLVVPNSYVASQHFNTETSRRVGMKARGDHMIITYQDDGLSLTVKDKTGRIIPVLSSSLKLTQNIKVHQETTIDLICSQLNCFARTALSPGLWRGEMWVEVLGQEPFQQAVELSVKGK